MNSVRFGLDFGTTNSSLAWSDNSKVGLIRFPYKDHAVEAYRSLLYLEQVKEHGRSIVKSWSGPEGIDHYLEAEVHGRLMQSLKSFLSSRTLESTEVFGRRHTLESLIARMLRDIREGAQKIIGEPVKHVISGRPVRFVGSENDDDDAFAEKRLAAAYRLAGFESVQFELEPIGAAHYYASSLDHDETVLIGDFGGGTSDFSLLRVGPGGNRLMGNEGVGIAGDAFDAKIIRRLVSPALGAGSSILSGDKLLPVPLWIYAKLERWHHLSFLRGRDVTNLLNSVRAQAVDRSKLDALLHIVNENLGFQLHRSVQAAKSALSGVNETTFAFHDGDLDIRQRVRRQEFEQWISEEISAIESCVDRLIERSGLAARDIDVVFLTGGSSFVPAVRRIFESRFGAERIRSGNEFTSVAYGLSLAGATNQAR